VVEKKFANAAVVYMWRHYYCVRMVALLVEKNPLMPPCCVRMAALLVETNPQMPPIVFSPANVCIITLRRSCGLLINCVCVCVWKTIQAFLHRSITSWRFCDGSQYDQLQEIADISVSTFAVKNDETAAMGENPPPDPVSWLVKGRRRSHGNHQNLSPIFHLFRNLSIPRI
jgi:hypothetical protein